MSIDYPQQTSQFKIWLCMCFTILASTNSVAGELKVGVNTKGDKPLSGVVMTLQPLGGASGESAKPKMLSVSIKQIDKEFVPAVTVVPVGSSVSFPNQDDIMHHVYSFSKAKTFDLPLYKGIPSEPVTFDTAGVATLGCNIHDWMSAHVLVVDTPYYEQTNELGEAQLADIAAGDYELVLWHPRQRKSYKEVITIGDQLIEKTVEVRLKPSFRSKRQNSKSNRNY